MGSTRRTVLRTALLALVLALVVVGARALGARSSAATDDDVEALRRDAGVVNRLSVANMLDVRVMVNVTGVDAAQWGRTPPDDEPPAGLQAEVVDAHRVSGEVWLRPLRIVDGGGDATFTIEVRLDDGSMPRPLVGTVPTRSTSLEFCGSTGTCIDGYAFFDWQDAPEPRLDVFRRCIVDDRVIGSYVDAGGVRREVHAAFQCDAVRAQSTLVLHD